MKVHYYNCIDGCGDAFGIEGVKSDKVNCPNCDILCKGITHTNFLHWQHIHGHRRNKSEEDSEIRQKSRKRKYI